MHNVNVNGVAGEIPINFVTTPSSFWNSHKIGTNTIRATRGKSQKKIPEENPIREIPEKRLPSENLPKENIREENLGASTSNIVRLQQQYRSNRNN